MSKITHQLEQLRIGGYREEADTMEALAKSMNLRAEYDYLMQFVKDNSFYDAHIQNQLRALWTAFCFHAIWEADTEPYDKALQEIWAVLKSNWKDFDTFDNFMCKFLA